MSLDMFDFVIINNLDKRLKTADYVYLAMPFLGFAAGAVAVAVVAYAVLWRKSLGVSILFLNQASMVLSATRLLVHIPVLSFLPLLVGGDNDMIRRGLCVN